MSGLSRITCSPEVLERQSVDARPDETEPVLAQISSAMRPGQTLVVAEVGEPSDEVVVQAMARLAGQTRDAQGRAAAWLLLALGAQRNVLLSACLAGQQRECFTCARVGCEAGLFCWAAFISRCRRLLLTTRALGERLHLRCPRRRFRAATSNSATEAQRPALRCSAAVERPDGSAEADPDSSVVVAARTNAWLAGVDARD